MKNRWLSPEQQRVWRRYLRVERLLPARLGHQLQVSSGLTGAEYEVLVNLSEVPGGRLRPYQLGEAMQWEQSRLSHQLTRMQRRGLVVREGCPKDGRGFFVVLTEAGRNAIESAAPAHVAAVRRLVFDQLTDAEAEAFGAACAKIAAALEQAPGPDLCSGSQDPCSDGEAADGVRERPGLPRTGAGTGRGT